MRILNEDTETPVSEVILYLLRDEAMELRDSLEQLLENSKSHYHVSAEDFQKQITVCLYDPDHLDEFGFNERSLKLIREDK